MNDSKRCLGIRRKMSQVVGGFAKTKNNEESREKYKGIFSNIEVGSFAFFGRIVNFWWLVLPVWIRCVARATSGDCLKLAVDCHGDTPPVGMILSGSNSCTSFSESRCSVDQAAKAEASLVSRAEATAYEEEHEGVITTIEFRIQRQVEFGQNVVLVGSVRELGDWDVAKGVPLHWSVGDIWTCRTTVKRADVNRIEYKYVVKGLSSGSIEWEAGGNHNVLKPAERRMVQEDFWAFPGYVVKV